MRSSFLLFVLAATTGWSPAVAAERTFTIDDRQYRFDFPSEIEFIGKRSVVTTDGIPAKVVDFSTERSDERYFSIHFSEVDASHNKFVKGYLDILDEDQGEGVNKDPVTIERHTEDIFHESFLPYDDFRDMHIIVAPSKCPSECAITAQFMFFRENRYDFGREIVDSIRDQLLSREFITW